ncbi:unnamed protein product [Rhizophagus irregularis]|nr:unnamed protein product [Rhizophagus irregularis]
MKQFRNLNKEELPTGIECGVTYKTDNLTLTINPSAYLNYLLNTFISLGGTTQHVSLSHLNECIESDTDVVINCSGIHAGTLGCVEDPEVYPARGQTVIVQLPQEYNEHNNSTDVDDNIAEAIIQRCLATRPDLLPPG